jgi:tetratricopeptide (TPR) repeat protein
MESSDISFYKDSLEYIKKVQGSAGDIPWEKNKKLDPWDHIESAMGLSVGGFVEESKRAFLWLKENQQVDGSWYSEYINGEPSVFRKETNFVAYISTGLWHYYLITEDKIFLQEMFPIISKSIEFVLSLQVEAGDIYWAVEEGKSPLDDSLITGSSSIYKSLECAFAIYNLLGECNIHIKSAMESLKDSINNNPDRYDRNWESKSRYSMDWYYPVLCGIYNDTKGIERIRTKWKNFIVEGKGCKCVEEEPWVTVAESSELVLTLVKLNLLEEAQDLFDSLHQWKDKSDGLYWTGYVYTDQKFWPIEKPTWTAGAVILAADSLFKFSPGNVLFSTDWSEVDSN